MNKGLLSIWLGVGLTLLPQISQAEISASNFITLSGGTSGDAVGEVLASGDFNGDGYQDIVTGAPNASINYIAITYGESSQLPEVTYSTSNSSIISDSTSTNQFGNALAVGDVNMDGYDDILIGAPGDTQGGTGNGAAYLLYGKSAEHSSGTVSANSEVVKFLGDTSSTTGESTAIGDVNGDGYADLIIGATTGHAGPTQSTGFFYIVYSSNTPFSGTSNGIAESPKFVGEATDDLLGSAVSAGDFNGDGYADVAVGAPGNDDGGSGAGAAYVVWGQAASFTGSLNTLTSYLQLSGAAAGDAAGTAVLVSSHSILDDSYNELIVTAPGSDTSASNAGSVYIFSGGAGSATANNSVSSATAILTGEIENDAVGDSLASRDFNLDGSDDLLIGATTPETQTGVVYQVNGSVTLANASLSTASNIFMSDSAGNSFGQSVAAGDLNGDGYPEVIIGVPGYSGNTGAVQIGYLYSQIELGNDGVDNDGDGSVDEVNTVAENGAHPVYSSLDPADTATTQVNITSVVGSTNGTILVTYADSSVYQYTVFTTTTSKTTKVNRFNRTGYAVALQRKGKKIVLVNLYSGDKPSSKKLNKKPATVAAFKLADLRSDNKKEAVVTNKRKSNVKVYIVKVNKTQGKLTLKDKKKVISKKVAPKKTKIKKNTVQLRNAKGKVLFKLKVNKLYHFID